MVCKTVQNVPKWGPSLQVQGIFRSDGAGEAVICKHFLFMPVKSMSGHILLHQSPFMELKVCFQSGRNDNGQKGAQRMKHPASRYLKIKHLRKFRECFFDSWEHWGNTNYFIHKNFTTNTARHEWRAACIYLHKLYIRFLKIKAYFRANLIDPGGEMKSAWA